MTFFLLFFTRNEKVLKFRAEILKRSQKYHPQVQSDFREVGWFVRVQTGRRQESLGHLGVLRRLGKSQAEREEGKGVRGTEARSGAQEAPAGVEAHVLTGSAWARMRDAVKVQRPNFWCQPRYKLAVCVSGQIPVLSGPESPM